MPFFSSQILNATNKPHGTLWLAILSRNEDQPRNISVFHKEYHLLSRVTSHNPKWNLET